MEIKPFELERYFAKYEFNTKYLLSCSDCEALELSELLAMANNDTLKKWQNLKLSYTESTGHPLLRHEIAKLHTTILPDEINVMVPEEGIFTAMNCILQPGDHVISTFPGYQSLYEIANSLGCEVSKWLPDYNCGWHFDIEKLKPLIRTNTKLLVVNFPHNPTGATVSKKDFTEIIELCKKNNTVLFSDEMYRFLEYDSKDRLPSASDLYENAISLFGMSKSFALPGLRIGWLSSHNKNLMNEIANFKDYTTICNNAPGEILAIIALQNKEKIVNRNLQIISENLILLDSFFKNYVQLFEWKPPVAGPIAFPKFLGKTEIATFCKNLIEKNEVMLLPSSVYGFEGNYFRIGFARKNMPEALEKLEDFLSGSKY
jgi:aspartate/methionine/tyrosine aminotransferase